MGHSSKLTQASMERLILFLTFTTLGCRGNYVDICKDGFTNENECCKLNGDEGDLGMEKHQYEVVYTKRSYTDQSIECRLKSLSDSSHNYHLVTFETRKEHDCVMRYLSEEHPDVGNLYIGLKADAGDHRMNVFNWEFPMDATPDGETLTFTNWAPTSPKGADCVSVNIGKASATNALWTDVACSTAYATICERYLKN